MLPTAPVSESAPPRLPIDGRALLDGAAAQGRFMRSRVPALDESEVSDLVAFLRTLTDVRGAARMPASTATPVCD